MMERYSRLLLVMLVVASLVAVPPAAANNSDQQIDTKAEVLEVVGDVDPANAAPDDVRSVAAWARSNGSQMTQAEYIRTRQWVETAAEKQSLGVEIPPERQSSSTSTATAPSDLTKTDVMDLVRRTEPAEATPSQVREVGQWISTTGPSRLTLNEYRAARAWVRQGIAANNVDLNTSMPSTDEFRDAVSQDEPAKDSELTYDQLAPRGDRPGPNAPQGVRAGGPYSEYGIRTLPTTLWALPFEGDDSPLWTFLSSGETVKRNKIKFATNRPRSMDGVSIEPKNYTLHIAYWQQESRYVERNNSTERVVYATNVSTVKRTYQMGDGRDEQMVPLRPHYDEAHQVTMCIEETSEDDGSCLAEPGSDRFRFTHASNDAYQVLPATSQGRRTVYAFGLVAITVLVTLVTLFSVRKLLDRALASPNISLLVWAIFLLISAAGVFILWDSLVEMFVLRPFLIAVPVGIFIAIVVAEWFGDSTYLAAAIRFSLDEVRDPGHQVDTDSVGEETEAVATDGGDGAPDVEETDAVPGGGDEDEETTEGVLKMDIVPMRMVRHDDGRASIGDGLRAFIARARGARADVEFDGNPLTRVEVGGGPYDEAYLLDPESEKPIEHERESHRMHIPAPISRERIETEDGEVTTRWETNLKPWVLGIGTLAAGWIGGALLLTHALLGLAIAGGLLTAIGIMQPDPGRMKLDLAPLHYHTAVGTMLTHASKLGDAKSWQSMYEELRAEKGRNRAEEKGLQDRGTRSQAEAVTEEYVAEEEYEDVHEDGHGREEVPADDD